MTFENFLEWVRQRPSVQLEIELFNVRKDSDADGIRFPLYVARDNNNAFQPYLTDEG